MKNCGNWKYHAQERICNGYVCANAYSERYKEWTDDDCSCEEWTEKEYSKLGV